MPFRCCYGYTLAQGSDILVAVFATLYATAYATIALGVTLCTVDRYGIFIASETE
jgi:hypothetical protein